MSHYCQPRAQGGAHRLAWPVQVDRSLRHRVLTRQLPASNILAVCLLRVEQLGNMVFSDRITFLCCFFNAAFLEQLTYLYLSLLPLDGESSDRHDHNTLRYKDGGNYLLTEAAILIERVLN